MAATSMLETLKKWFVADSSATDSMTPELAAVVLLLEIAWSDGGLADSEQQQLLACMENTLGISGDQLSSMNELAQTLVSESNDLFRFTRLVNDSFSYPQKCQLLQALWQVAYADQVLDKYEEYTLRKIADLLYIDHPDFIRAKQAARLE